MPAAGLGRGRRAGGGVNNGIFAVVSRPAVPGGVNNGIFAVVSSPTARGGTYNGIFAVVSRPAAPGGANNGISAVVSSPTARGGVNNGISAVVSRPTARDGANNGTFAVVSRPAARGGANNGISAVVPRPAARRRRRHPFCHGYGLKVRFTEPLPSSALSPPRPRIPLEAHGLHAANRLRRITDQLKSSHCLLTATIILISRGTKKSGIQTRISRMSLLIVY
ncbi:hypothetical protein [Paenibacillus sonchi]|uniref:hypothetical protein n=1 Tax=Paenibacillus sonchi TaxID=373687 RepID=UPI001E2F66E5|nr:hypothetical protein [Paenibacillus sonchi]MCE3198341.1 hypothetical protein [Paenibacillus sonchi]